MSKEVKKVLLDREYYYYYQVIGCKWFNRAKVPFGKLEKGDIINIYRKEYEVNAKGDVSKWIEDSKYGCEFDGVSLESSFKKADEELEQYFTTWPGSTYNRKPLTGLEPCV